MFTSSYIKKLEIVRNEVKANVEKSKGKMFRKVNERISPLNIRVGDLVKFIPKIMGCDVLSNR
jgi:hypothetical protein